VKQESQRRTRSAAAPLTSTRSSTAVQRVLVDAYRALSDREGLVDAPVAVRSSATAEDLPEASFAGQQETFLNVSGDVDVVEAYQRCLASLYTDRAIAYRDEHRIQHVDVSLSVGVRRMVRSDLGCSGVMFTLDPETGFPNVVVINGSWGLGENIVKGVVVPDELVVWKGSLDDARKRPLVSTRIGAKERMMVLARGGHATTCNLDTPLEKRQRLCLDEDDALALARMALAIERNASEGAPTTVPMDIEWAKDGLTGQLYIVQARPETVHARKASSGLVRWELLEEGRALAQGTSVGEAIATGPVVVLKSVSELARLKPGSILVAETTDPDWVPAMRMAAGIVTEHGGRTCHAAIVSREPRHPRHRRGAARDDAARRGRAGHALLRLGRERRGLRGRRPVPPARGAADGHPRDEDARDDQPRRPLVGALVVEAADGRRRPRAPRVHHRRACEGASDGARPLRRRRGQL
jgi:pyruvate,water dikinase